MRSADVRRQKASESDPPAPVCLYRATNGKRKESTAVSAADAPRFHAAYTVVIKSSMTALKRAKKPRKAKAAA